MNESIYSAVKPTKPAAPWLGGKSKLADAIIERIHGIEHKTYAEPFVGMGGIFFRRNRVPPCEVINDRSGDVANFFRILQRHYVQYMDMLKWQVTTRREFERLVKTDPTTLTDLERAASFLYRQRTSFGGKATGQAFGVSPGRPARFDVSTLGPHLEELHERLSGVIVENLDWSELVRRYDQAETLFYLDPPYWDCEDDYGKGMFGKEQFEKMATQLAAIEGKFVLSLNDVPDVRATFSDFELEQIETTYTISEAGSKKVSELLISNVKLSVRQQTFL